MARGFSQKKEEDYEETLPRDTCVRIIIASVINLYHMDVKVAFLNGVIEEEVYIEQPQGFEVHEEAHVCRLKKALYRPQVWYSQIDGYLMSLG